MKSGATTRRNSSVLAAGASSPPPGRAGAGSTGPEAKPGSSPGASIFTEGCCARGEEKAGSSPAASTLMKVRTISLWQPWASLMAIGAKRNETRSWFTAYRGPLAIHAAMRWTRQQADALAYPPFSLYTGDLLPIKLGVIVAVVDLVDCILSDEWDVQNTPLQELQFGDYGPGRWIWKTENLWRPVRPIPVRGRQGFFNVEMEL